MVKIKHRVGIVAPIDSVWNALTTARGFSGWWSSSASFDPSTIRLEFTSLTTLTFDFNAREVERCVRLQNRVDPYPWGGSDLEFRLSVADNQVFVTLSHIHPDASEEDFQFFMTKWPIYLVSLKKFAETGVGDPYPSDVKIQADL